MKLNTSKKIQFTVRRVPAHVDRALRRRAQEENRSLNSVLLEALEEQAGSTAVGRQRFNDLDELAGLWQADTDFDEAITRQHQIDYDLWK